MILLFTLYFIVFRVNNKVKSFLEYLFEAKSKSGSVDPEKTIHEFLTAVVLVNKKLLDITTLNSQNFAAFCKNLDKNEINLNSIIVGTGLSDNSINSYKNYFLTNAYKDQKNGTKKIDKDIFGVLARAISAAQAIVNTYRLNTIENVYLTGNVWHSDIKVYKDIAENPLINEYGIKDFNSSDIVLIATTEDGNREAFGISLKHARNIKERPTVLNAALYKALNNVKIDSDESNLLPSDKCKTLGDQLETTTKEWFIDTVKNNLSVLVGDEQQNDLYIPDSVWKHAKVVELKENEKVKEKIKAELSNMTVNTFAKTFNKILMNNTEIDKGKRIKDHTRTIINSLLGDKQNSCFAKMVDVCQQYSTDVAEMLVALIFRSSLRKLKNISDEKIKKIISELNEYKDKELLNFNFALVTGLEQQERVSEAEAKEKSITIVPGTCETAEQFDNLLVKFTPDTGKNKNYELILTPDGKSSEKSSIPATDNAAKSESNPAKVFIDLVWKDENGKEVTVANLNIRYKGSYTPSPQFQGTISDEFLNLLSDKEKLSNKEK